MSKKHVYKHRAVGYGASKRSIDACFNRGPTIIETKVKEAEITLTGFLAEHNISLRCADHLVAVNKKCFEDSKVAQQVSLGRTKATVILKHVIGKCHSLELAQILRRNKFSIIIDESTDVSSVKTLAVCVRYAAESGDETRFWKMVQLFSGHNPQEANEGATAERIFDAVIKSFQDEEIDLNNVIGFASDGCSTMMGGHNSVAQRLSSLLPGIIIQKCICHSLHLCASQAYSQLPSRCENLARSIYNYFKNSSKRQAQFQEFQDFCNAETHKILRPYQTRWLSLLSVVKRIIEQWQPLKLFFYFAVARGQARNSESDFGHYESTCC